MSYMIDKFKGIYRLKVPYNLATKQFSRKLNGTFEDIDIYIDCKHGNKIMHYGGSILQAYIPSLIRGHNIIKLINEIESDLIFDIEETSQEILFKFNYKHSDKIIPLLNPKTSGANISPFSSRNLPKNKDYKIPDEEFVSYKEIVSKIPRERMIDITHTTNNYLKSLTTKRNTGEDIKADMAKKCLKPKEYIHSIGKWNDYINYLRKELKV